MNTIKYSVTYYQGIAETPMVILLDREQGKHKNQFDTVEELKSFIGENPIIYFVADRDDNRISGLQNWRGGQFDFKILENITKIIIHENFNIMEQVTLKVLQELSSVEHAISWARKQYGDSPKLPTKPVLKNNHTSEDVGEYQKNLQLYEKAYDDYKIEKERFYTNRSKIDAVIVEFIKEESGLNSIPEQYREKIYSKAYEDGHSDGYYEVYLKLNSLIEIFD